MKQIADDVFLLAGFPPAAYNVHLLRTRAGWFLVDTATRHARRRILRQLPGKLEAILVTHAHQDHAGAMHDVALATGAPVWGPEVEADALEGKAPRPLPEAHRNHVVNRLFADGWRDPHPVARKLNPGEMVGDFELVAFPGHTAGMLGLWRESDRTVLCADAMRSMNFYTGLPQLGEMPAIFTCDIPEARRSIRKLAQLEPRVVCFGHGRPLTHDATARLQKFAATLPVS